ncbi:MAG: lipoprotein [Leptothrix sp. (in: b-proteobacteria)]
MTGLESSLSAAPATRAGAAKFRTCGLWLCICAALLAGCGQKGPLYLPAPPAGATSSTPAASAAAASAPAR